MPRLLIVEGDDRVRGMLAVRLATAGFITYEACSTHDACAIFDSIEPEAVLTSELDLVAWAKDRTIPVFVMRHSLEARAVAALIRELHEATGRSGLASVA